MGLKRKMHNEEFECSQEETINQIKQTVIDLNTKFDKLHSDIHGNGKDGMHDTVIILNENVKNLTDQVKESGQIQQTLTTSVNGLLIFKKEVEVKAQLKEVHREQEKKIEEKKKDQKLTTRQWLLVVIITGLSGLGGLTISLITLINHLG